MFRKVRQVITAVGLFSLLYILMTVWINSYPYKDVTESIIFDFKPYREKGDPTCLATLIEQGDTPREAQIINGKYPSGTLIDLTINVTEGYIPLQNEYQGWNSLYNRTVFAVHLLEGSDYETYLSGDLDLFQIEAIADRQRITSILIMEKLFVWNTSLSMRGVSQFLFCSSGLLANDTTIEVTYSIKPTPFWVENFIPAVSAFSGYSILAVYLISKVPKERNRYYDYFD